jgi:hypothetical protein
LVALSIPDIRYVNTVLAIWLFISAFALPGHRLGTTWNSVLVAIAIFLVSLTPTSPAGSRMAQRRVAA